MNSPVTPQVPALPGMSPLGFKQTPDTVREKEEKVKKDVKKLNMSSTFGKFGDEDDDAPVKFGITPREKPSRKPIPKKPIKKAPVKAPPKKAKREEEKVHGRIVNTNSRKLKSNIGDCTKKSYIAIAAAFGKGKTVEDAISDLEINYEPPRSKEYERNPRKYLLGYISTMCSKKLLTEI